jgi:hypothetical protein
MISPRMQSIALDDNDEALKELHHLVDTETVCTEEVTTADDDMFELDHDRWMSSVPSKPQTTAATTITTFHGMICDQLYGSPQDNISAKAIVQNNSHPSKQQQQRRGGLLEDCVDTFAKNVDFVQAQAEQWTQDIVQVGEEKGLTTFVQARMNTFTRNLETIGAILTGA